MQPFKNLKSFGKTIGYGTAMATAFVVVARMVDEIIDYLKERGVKAKSSAYYAKMIEAHPQLKKEDPKIVARYWESLYHFAPYMAQDPLAAGSFIRQAIARGLPEEFGGPAPDTYLTLTDINSKLRQAKPDGPLADARKQSLVELGKRVVTAPFDF